MYTCYLNELWTIDVHFPNSRIWIWYIFSFLKKMKRDTPNKWRSRGELISDVLLWTPTYGRAKAGRPARTYIQQLCEDTGCNPEDLTEAMNDREKWRERVRDNRGGGTTWWWWWWLKIIPITSLPLNIFIYQLMPHWNTDSLKSTSQILNSEFLLLLE